MQFCYTQCVTLHVSEIYVQILDKCSGEKQADLVHPSTHPCIWKIFHWQKCDEHCKFDPFCLGRRDKATGSNFNAAGKMDQT